MAEKKALRERPIVSPLVADATQIGAHQGILASSAAEKLSLQGKPPALWNRTSAGSR